MGILGFLLYSLVSTSQASSTGTDEMLSSIEMVPPVVIFVVDTSDRMMGRCDLDGGTASCLADTFDAISSVVRHFDNAQYGVVATSKVSTTDSYREIAPVGSSYAEIAAALSSIPEDAGTTRNLAETLESVSSDYLMQSAVLDEADNDGDGMTGDWDESPIAYSCTDVHLVVITRGRGTDDDQVTSAYYSASSSSSTEVACDASWLTATDEQCYYDNVVAHLYNTDHSSLSDTQRVITHTVYIEEPTAPDSVADAVFASAATNTVGDGIFDVVNDNDDILSSILSIMSTISEGAYTRSAPVLSADGAYLIYTFFEMTGDNPLAQGHIRAYEIDDDPTSATYGEAMYEGPSAYGGAVWDGGDLLVSRPITASESNPDDRDGVGKRDIYTWEDGASGLSSLGVERSAGRLGFDYDFAQAVGSSPAVLSTYFNTALGSVAPCAEDLAYDLDGDCRVDGDDLQVLVDFARGLPESEFRYLDMTRGPWKLGDSPYSIPVVVNPRNDMYATDPTYRRFLEDLEADNQPSIVLVAANDGMLHAFRLEDDPSTATEDEAGEELWAWIPGYLLLRDKDEEWANSLIDLMWYGRTFLFDGSPVVEDVWIDADDDGVKASDGSEWRRVVVVQQGMGGPVTLALDITNSQAPEFLWEQTNTSDTTAMGYTVGRPAIFNVYDASDITDPRDRWVAMWGGGRAVAYKGASGTDYWESAEADLYMWNIGDDWKGTQSVGYSEAGDNIDDAFPDLASNGGSEGRGSLDYNDSPRRLEYGYISAAVAAVDVDSDGDSDVIYFPVATAYRPADEGGGGISDAESPGSSWMFKAILNTRDPDDLEWCEFYDPLAGTDGTNGVGARPEVYYAATTSWLEDGSLGVYWGSGTPYDRDGTATGYFFAMQDVDPLSCTSRAQPIPCNGNDGFYPLEGGEGLTADPIVYAGVVYFSTYTPNPDRCEMGTGRVYGIRFDDCTPGLDSDGDGEATTSDTPYVEQVGYVSGVAVTSFGTVLYGSATGPDSGGSAVEVIRSATDPFLGTAAIAWLEIF
jgi:hypothetical protein